MDPRIDRGLTRRPDAQQPEAERRQRVLHDICTIADNAIDNSYGARLGRTIAWSFPREGSHDLKEKMAELQRSRTEANEAGEAVGLYIHTSGERQVAGFSSVRGEITIPVEGLMIDDPDKLLAAMELLQPADVVDNEENRRRFTEVVKAMNNQLIAEYEAINKSGGDPRLFLQLIEKMNAIAERLAAFVDIDALARTKRIIDNARTMTLGEYLQMDKAQCFDPPKSRTFGPSMWHMDTTPDDYQRRWRLVRESIEKAQRNPHASTLVFEVLSNLKACVLSAQEDLEKDEGDGDLKERTDSCKATLTAVSQWIDHELGKMASVGE